MKITTKYPDSPKRLKNSRKQTINELDEQTRQLMVNRINRRIVSNQHKQARKSA